MSWLRVGNRLAPRHDQSTPSYVAMMLDYVLSQCAAIVEPSEIEVAAIPRCLDLRLDASHWQCVQVVQDVFTK